MAAAAQAEQLTAPIGGGLSVEIWTPEEAQTEPVTANAFGATIPAKPANPFLKLFQPKKKVQLKPVILYVHGGGWLFGTPRSHRVITSNLARAAGIRRSRPGPRRPG